MDAAREQLRRWTDGLLDVRAGHGELRAIVHAWYRWAVDVCGLDDDAPPVRDNVQFTETRLDSGCAISPVGAARCLWEYRRTAVFLRAMDAAIQRMRARFPGETIHILEAGCGPLAPLVLPFALRYSPAEVQFTVLDIHAPSLACVRKLAEKLGVQASLRGLIETDAATMQIPEAERPHLIACEVLLNALKKEPQVAVTLNLAPQLRPGGVFLPERIDVRAALYDTTEHHRPPEPWMEEPAIMARGVAELGPIFSLEALALDRLQRLAPDRLAAGCVIVPPHHCRTPLSLMTRIRVFEEHVLQDFECSLNLPLPVPLSHRLAYEGGAAQFYYELSATPGLRLQGNAARVRPT